MGLSFFSLSWGCLEREGGREGGREGTYLTPTIVSPLFLFRGLFIIIPIALILALFASLLFLLPPAGIIYGWKGYAGSLSLPAPSSTQAAAPAGCCTAACTQQQAASKLAGTRPQPPAAPYRAEREGGCMGGERWAGGDCSARTRRVDAHRVSHTDTHTESHTHAHTVSQTRHRHRDSHTDKTQSLTQTDTVSHRHRWTYTVSHPDTGRHTHTVSHTDTDRQTDRVSPVPTVAVSTFAPAPTTPLTLTVRHGTRRSNCKQIEQVWI